MASFTADNANITGQVGTPVDNPIKGVKFAKFVYTIVGTEAATDTITLGTLPTGATIIPQLSYLTRRSDPGTALTIDIGYSGDADNWNPDCRSIQPGFCSSGRILISKGSGFSM